MDGVRRSCFSLRRDPTEAREARRLVARACDGLAHDVVEIAQLLTTELVTNALDHGAGEITLGIARSDDDLRIDVGDAAPGHPRPSPALPEQTRGRGMLLVESLAAGWGVEPPSEGGKRVWFRLRVGAPSGHARH
jgi:anti-sigma regulatory factor (Ser/Thr protein kinase)